jgi:hypothetical protein
LDNYARVLSALEFFENLRRKLILESTDRQRLTSFLTSERSGINYLLEIRQSRIANRVRREKFLIRRIEKKSKMSDPIFISEKVEFCVKTILDFQDFLSSRSFLNFGPHIFLLLEPFFGRNAFFSLFYYFTRFRKI